MKRILLAGAALAIASLSGCQGGGTQFANPFSSREVAQPNAMPGMMPASPAFSRVQAGQNMAMMAPGYPQGQPMMMAPGYPQGQPMMVPQQGQPMMMAQQPIVGSGGMVYPVGYQQGQPMMMQPAPGMAPGMAYPPSAGPAAVYTPNAPVMQAPPPVMPNNPQPTQPGVTTIQGPNGPITVTTEVFDQPPPVQSQPTFTPPAPVTIPLPEPVNLPSLIRPPEASPAANSIKGPSLPGMNSQPGVGTYPVAPVGHQQAVPQPRLPAPTAPAVEDDIPSAPITIPGR